MTGLIGLSALARDLFVLWALLVCFGSIICAVQSYKNMKPVRIMLSVLCFAASYGTVRIRKYVLLYLRGTEGRIAEKGLRYGGLPWVLWPAALLTLTVILILMFADNRRFAANSITPTSIKSFLDEIPCGICYYMQDGQVIFSNRCINRLCIALTNGPLIDANTFRKAITDDIMTVNGRKWCFAVRKLTLDHERIYEMIASDRTELCETTEALRQDNVKLAQMNRELREYNLAIDDIVRRQEILQAKIDIHDEMNQLILSAATLSDDDPEELDRVFSRWHRNLKLLHMNADDRTHSDEYDRLKESARALGIVLNVSPIPPGLSDQQKELLFIAAREAIANAAKHAHASHIDILFEENEFEISCCFRNDGQIPTNEIRFTGGLKNLKDLAAKYCVEITAEVSSAFMMRLSFPRQAGYLPNGRCKPDNIRVE